MLRKPLRNIIQCLFIVSILLSVSACSPREEFQRGYLVDESTLAKVKKGMRPEQVLQTLGSPSTVSTVGNKTWYYISQKTQRRLHFMGENTVDQKVVAVYFSPQFRVERIAHYGIQDGKVFDFISRKTISGGSDQDFVSQLFRNLLSFEKK